MKIETDASFYKTDGENYIRSSSLKTFQSCSWLYYQDYVNKVPQINNKGAMCGNVCHSVFECLLNTRHINTYKKIIKSKSIANIPSTNRLIKKLIRKNNLPETEEIFNKIVDMIWVGLNTDFYVKGGKIIGKEYRFKIKSKSPKYSIYGTIDKIAIKDDYIIIHDFKSSKLQYSGEDLQSNTQALMYSLAASKLWPKYKNKVIFIFLQYPENPIQELEFDKNTLLGFEYFLEHVQKQIDSFTEQDAKNNFAVDKRIPKDGGFGGKIQCGFAKYPGQLKKNGELMWACSFKFKRDYYVLIKDGQIIKSAHTKEELIPKDGELVEIRNYLGCPKFFNALDVINTENKTKITSKRLDNKNILDDW